MAARFGLPESVHDGATLAAHVLVVPHPGFGVDGLAHAAQDAQARQVRACRVYRLVSFRSLDERTDGRGCCVEDGALVALDHLPEAAGIREGGNAFKDDLRGACSQRAIGDVGVARDPADVGRAPEHIVSTQVERPVHGHLGPQQVAAGAVLHAFGLAGRAAGVEDEQRMLGTHSHRRAFGALPCQCFGKGLVAPGHHVAGRGRALVDKHIAEGVAAAHGQGFVDDGLERQLFAAPHLVIGGDHGHGTRVNDALVHRLGAEAAKHHAVRGANAGTGLHRHHAFDGHRHIDQHPVALAHAMGLEGVGKLAHTGQQLFVGDLGDRAIVGLKEDGGLVLGGRADVAVQAVGRGIEFAVGKPLVKRCVGLIQRARERLGPLHVLARQARPEAFEVLVGFGTQRIVARHA
ncbi:hypothetical protein D3C71_916150 [compost metagenome]